MAVVVKTQTSKNADGEAVAAEITDPDVELMLGFQRGDERCFDALYQKYKRPLLAFAFRLTGRRDRAEELVQEIFIRCYRAAPKYRPDAKLSTWIFHIARNCCRNEFRRPEYRHRSEPYVDQGKQPPAASPESQVVGRELQWRAQAALAALPERQRTALVLSRFHQMSYEEIAKTMGTSVSAIKSLLNRAKERLIELMRARGGRDEL